jgi:hypothetical protein
MVLPALRDSYLCVVCCCFFGTDENCNFSAVHYPIELKLGGDLGLVSQISVHWFQDSIVFHIVNKETKCQNREKRGFRKLEFSPPFQLPSTIDLKLGGDIRTRTRNSVVCFFILLLFVYIL